MLSKWLLCEEWAEFITGAAGASADTRRHSQNAERVQIAVMKLFHYGDEQCWINRNNKVECCMEPSVEEELWQHASLFTTLINATGQDFKLLCQLYQHNIYGPALDYQNIIKHVAVVMHCSRQTSWSSNQALKWGKMEQFLCSISSYNHLLQQCLQKMRNHEAGGGL